MLKKIFQIIFFNTGKTVIFIAGVSIIMIKKQLSTYC